MTDDLIAALRGPDPDLTELRQKLMERAETEHLIDVAYRRLDSPVGPLLLAATAKGLVRVGFADVEGEDAVLTELSAAISPRVLSAPARLDRVAHELDEYFAGERTAFDVPLDRRLSRGFRLDVLEHLTDIGYGRTASYAAVAALAGNPRAVRAVGTACATNPIPLVVPCHRVVRADGSYGRYRGGEAAKRLLLTMEAEHPR